MTTSNDFQNVPALGQWARRARKAQGLTLRALADRAGLGIRFLSEFERGKETAELGKVLAALHTLGLRLVPDTDPGTRAATGSLPHSPAPPPLAQTSHPVMPSRPAAGGNAARLWDMLQAAGEIQEMLGARADETDFRQSKIMPRAVERCFDVIGEAARRVTPDAQARLPRIPWRALIARRNELVMAYEQVNHAALFQAAQAELPDLIVALRTGLAATRDQISG